MKALLGIALAVGLGVIVYQSSAETLGPNDYYVVMKFTSGNTIAFSEKYIGYESCINSPEYKLHSAVANTSNSNILCVNELPTYR